MCRLDTFKKLWSKNIYKYNMMKYNIMKSSDRYVERYVVCSLQVPKLLAYVHVGLIFYRYYFFHYFIIYIFLLNLKYFDIDICHNTTLA